MTITNEDRHVLQANAIFRALVIWLVHRGEFHKIYCVLLEYTNGCNSIGIYFIWNESSSCFATKICIIFVSMIFRDCLRAPQLLSHHRLFNKFQFGQIIPSFVRVWSSYFELDLAASLTRWLLDKPMNTNWRWTLILTENWHFLIEYLSVVKPSVKLVVGLFYLKRTSSSLLLLLLLLSNE